MTEISRPRTIGWSLILLVLMLVFGSVGLAAAPTTSASGPVFTYDVPSYARVDVRNVEGAEAGPERPGLALEDSASPPSSARGTSAPRSVAFVATEAGARFVVNSAGEALVATAGAAMVAGAGCSVLSGIAERATDAGIQGGSVGDVLSAGFNPKAIVVSGVMGAAGGALGYGAAKGLSKLGTMAGEKLAERAAAREAGALAEGAGSVGQGAARVCSANSFTASTPVVLGDGRSVAISLVRVGDEVLATDPVTGVTKGERVDGVIVHGGVHAMVDVGLEDASVVSAPDRHPLWVESRHDFVFAVDVRVGDVLRGVDGRLVHVQSVRSYNANLDAFNLSVTEIHTFYAGTTPVLVHNTCSSDAAKLGANLEAAGTARPAESAAHHIVGSGAEAAGRAREMLTKFGIGINSAENGVFLPANMSSANPLGAAVHSTIHGAEYYGAVTKALGGASSVEEAVGALDLIRSRLLSGGYP